MPYSVDSENLPSNVKKLSKKKREQWVSIFNSTIKDGKSEEDAFKLANGVAKKQKGWLDTWDVESRQLSPEEANYNSLGATETEGCAACNWFVSPDTCVLVAGDVSPTGVCKMFMEEVPWVQEPMPVTIVKENITVTIDDEQSLFKRFVEKLKEIFLLDSVPETPPVHETVVMPGLDELVGITTNKQTNKRILFYKSKDDLRFFGVFSNCYKDREGEVISDAAHRDYVAWADRTKLYPDLRLWHCGEKSNWGKVDWLDYTDGFMCASGIVDKGKEYIAESISEQDDTGMSHGFLGLVTNKGVIERYRSFEISTLPVDAAANFGTDFNIVGAKEMPFTDTKRAWLKDTAKLTDDQIKEWESTVDGLKEHMKSLGLEYKEAPDISLEVASLAMAVKDLAKVVNDQQAKIEEATKSLDDKVADVFKAEIAKLPQGFSASESKETVVEKKDTENDLSWFGQVLESITK